MSLAGQCLALGLQLAMLFLQPLAGAQVLSHLCPLHSLFTKNSSVKAFFSGLHCMACGISVPQPENEPGPNIVKVPSLNHWSAREFPSQI